jgi:hypothetical protein
MTVCPTQVINTSFIYCEGMKKGENLVAPGKVLSFLHSMMKRLPEAVVIWMSAYYLRENRK